MMPEYAHSTSDLRLGLEARTDRVGAARSDSRTVKAGRKRTPVAPVEFGPLF
jgi:hypothetical protein